MANGKSGQNKRVSPLATIIGLIVLILASMFGINLNDVILNETNIPTHQEETQPAQNVEGQLVVHMIDVGQADCFLLVQESS